MLANDPHLPLTSPSTFYEAHLVVQPPAQQPLNIYGVTFAGAPGFPQGFNDNISWGSTNNPIDVTDFYQERVITSDAGVPMATVYKGKPEPLNPLLQTFRVNVIGDKVPDNTVVVTDGVPPGALVVPRRNNGALVTHPDYANPNGPTAISFSWVGCSATRELESFLVFSRARNLDEFKQGLQFQDVGAQNWSYIDRAGNIAYFTAGKVPLRADLEAGTVDGPIPPWIVRDGTGTLRHDWVANDTPSPDQPFGYRTLPLDEMPQLVNPARGFIVNSNNDPIGTTLGNNPLSRLRRGGQGFLYLAYVYSEGNRAARIEQLINQKLGAGGKISSDDMARIQSDVALFDAEVMTPYIAKAFANAQQSGAPASLAGFANDPGVKEAVGRLSSWDFTAPTGIPEGFDAGNKQGGGAKPSATAVADSVAATIYSVWRGRFIANTIDATLGRVGLTSVAPGGENSMVALRHLLDNFSTSHGRGASGLNFFEIPNVNLAPEVKRDVILLQSLKDALNLLASPDFSPAFAGSHDQNDYRWGKLHRIVFSHPLETAPFDIPPGAGFNNLSTSLPGISTDGGFDTVNSATHIARAASLNAFMFNSGPSRRFIGEAGRKRVTAVEIIPGGESGVPGTPFFGNLLDSWLTKNYHAAFTTNGKVDKNGVSDVVFEPAK
jgi:penicillin amidase